MVPSEVGWIAFALTAFTSVLSFAYCLWVQTFFAVLVTSYSTVPFIGATHWLLRYIIAIAATVVLALQRVGPLLYSKKSRSRPAQTILPLARLDVVYQVAGCVFAFGILLFVCNLFVEFPRRQALILATWLVGSMVMAPLMMPLFGMQQTSMPISLTAHVDLLDDNDRGHAWHIVVQTLLWLPANTAFVGLPAAEQHKLLAWMDGETVPDTLAQAFGETSEKEQLASGGGGGGSGGSGGGKSKKEKSRGKTE